MHASNELKSTPIVSDSLPTSTSSSRAVNEWGNASEIIQLIITALGLIIVSPLFMIIAILIKLTSPGPIFYRGLRVGRGRHIFKIFKFRTLYVGAEKEIGARLLNEQDSFYTKIGKFLKRTKLDELPQLINVLKGEMNLVGPRPIRPIFLDMLAKEIPLYDLRFAVKPGMTGLAQIKGGYFTNPKDKLRYELIYIKNRSFILDLKLIFLTFFKLLNRWFTLGFLCLILFFFVSFIHESLAPSIYTHILGVRINVIHLVIILGGGWLLAKRIPKGKMYIYRMPLNVPMLAFFLFTLATSYFAIQPFSALRGSFYYAVTGFMVVFLLVNGGTTHRFLVDATKIVSIITVCLALVGLLELFLLLHSASILVDTHVAVEDLDLPRISSTLSNPVVLSTYLVLGFPLLLCQLTYAKRKALRDFWLISATVVFISVILTQTRVGLLSLAVTGSIFFYRSSPRKFITFILGSGILFLLLTSSAAPRYSPTRIKLEWGEALTSSVIYLSEMSLERLLIGIGTKGAKQLHSPDSSVLGSFREVDRPLPANMHLVLIIENGLIGWGILMWIVVAALRTLYIGYKNITDPISRTTLWAIFSSVSGFALSMNGITPFFYISLQVLFWSLLGIGVAIVVRFSVKRHGFVRVWKFGD